MINNDKVIDILTTMKNDIENTMVKDDLDKWSYHFTIYSKNNTGLLYSSYLMKLLGVRTNFIGLVPSTYKHCAFDCVTIATIFNDIYFDHDINTEGISILEYDTLNDDDFYVLVTKDSRMNSDKNIIMGYKTFHEYFR